MELSAGPLKAKMGELRSLPRVDPTALPTYPETAAEPQGWTKVRDELGKTARGVHLVHVVEPSTVEPGWFEIYAYLVGHKRGQYGYPADLSDVEKAEFYLGRFWGNEIFPVSGTGGREPIGLATRAFGPTTAVCRVHFTDGATAILSRYLDLELEVGF